jgi:hypothetical protein
MAYVANLFFERAEYKPTRLPIGGTSSFIPRQVAF